MAISGAGQNVLAVATDGYQTAYAEELQGRVSCDFGLWGLCHHRSTLLS